MAIMLLVGAGRLAALMAAERIELGRASSRVAAASDPSGACVSATPVPEGSYCERNEASLRESAAPSRVSHSHTTSADQPSPRNALSEALSRATLRPILARQ